MESTLNPVHDSRKSFYGKAIVIHEGGKIKLRSYNTIVAEIEGTEATIHGFYSATTTRHIKDFLYQNGFEIGTKAQLEKMYMQD